MCISLQLDFEILIINDGSKDDTLQVAQALSKEIPGITIHHHPANLGFGSTIKEVFVLPTSEWVLFLPGDNQFPASNIPLFLNHRTEADFVLGYRSDRKDTLRRKFYSRLYNWVISYTGGVNVHDVNSICLLRRDLLNGVDLRSVSAFIHAEVYIKLARKGTRILELRVEHQEREFGFGAGGNIKVIWATIKELILFLRGKL